MSTSAPYGSWKSPITAESIAAGTLRLGQIAYDGEDVYWTEGRAQEGGRQVIVKQVRGGARSDVIAAPYNARTLVHEYGGGAFAVHKGMLVFANFADQRLYAVRDGKQPQALTKEGKWRYADVDFDDKRSRLLCVREDHTQEDKEAVNAIVDVFVKDIDDPDWEPALPGSILVSGANFYSNPRVSPDGRGMCWLSWNHPNMPWDGTELWVAEFAEDGSVKSPRKIAGGPKESVFQPQWSPDGSLVYISDRTNWWNLYLVKEPWKNEATVALYAKEAEFGMPQWVFGMSTYGFSSAHEIICAYTQNGAWHLASIDISKAKPKVHEFESEYTEMANMNVSAGFVCMHASSPTIPGAIVEFELHTKAWRVLQSSVTSIPDQKFLSQPQAIEFPTTNGLTAYAFFYPPKNADFTGRPGELPPLVVKSHGGPTGATSSSFNLGIQYWTSRGFAVVDVNYGGSTGYGREYRERLYPNWGIVDVQDCENAAKYLVDKKLVDGKRLAITGGSAGGYTTLCALVFTNTFKAGASHFGVSDVEALALDTHKFESRYGDQLTGPYPEAKDVYIARSPIHHTDKLSCPIIFFQGLEDKVVPPSQAEAMVEAMRKRKLPVAYIPFEGEQHGFRKAENITRALEAELYFYAKIFGFEPADSIPPVDIENLMAGRPH